MFVAFQALSVWLILNLTIAAVIDGMQTAQEDDDRFFKSQDIDDFIDLWQQYDPENTGAIPIDQFFLFLSELQPPFTDDNIIDKEILVPGREGGDFGYFVNYKKKFRVRKYKILKAVQNLYINVSVNSDQKIFI